MQPPDPAAHAREHRVALALRDALPTRRHGEMLFDIAAEMLGDAGRLEVAADGNRKVLYRMEGADPRWVVPWPLLTLDRNPRRTFRLEIPGVEPAPPLPPRPGKAPKLRGLGPGYIQIQDGVRYVQVAYADDGRWFETSRGGPSCTLEGVLAVLAAGGGAAAERLAEFVVGLDPAGRGPLRAFLPDPKAWGAWEAWFCGMPRLRAALDAGRIPADARWAALDTVDGTALAWGATREEAVAAWSREVLRVRPGSTPPPPPPSFEPPAPPELPPPEGADDGPRPPLRIRIDVTAGGDPALPPPEFRPPPAEILPAVVIPLPDLPPEPAPLGSWRRFLDGCGGTVPGARREDAEGWTLVGKPALDALGAAAAEAALDEAERAHEAFLRAHGQRDAPAAPDNRWTTRLFELLDPETGRPFPPRTRQSRHAAERSLPFLDGDFLALGAARMRPTRP